MATTTTAATQTEIERTVTDASPPLRVGAPTPSKETMPHPPPDPRITVAAAAHVCIDCLNGDHEVSGDPTCECFCHGWIATNNGSRTSRKTSSRARRRLAK